MAMEETAKRFHTKYGDAVPVTTRNMRHITTGHIYSRHRIAELSLPRQSQRTELTSFHGPLTWGNQETIWPLNPHSLKHEASDRTLTLAQPKKNFRPDDVHHPQFQYSCGRESTIWSVSKGAKNAEANQRVQALAQPKEEMVVFKKNEPRLAHEIGSCGRVSPIWIVSEAAQKCGDRPRTAQLAVAKQPPAEYQPAKSVMSVVSEAAKTATASERLEQLAQPKKREEGFIRDAQWEVSSAARQATASSRTEELAKSKTTADGYRPARSPIWQVSKAVKHAAATPRLNELSVPITRETMDHLQFNPDAFIVSRNALKAKASARLEELAQPIDRK